MKSCAGVLRHKKSMKMHNITVPKPKDSQVLMKEISVNVCHNRDIDLVDEG
jgi:D-arabinose 1-dehydrogenase-like Zn-dependent alcohol dehydrogenase